jgi:manganese efflux pump family protein
MAALLVLGFVLSLDNFRVAIALGVLRFSWSRAVQVAVTFGVWDGLMPLMGLLLGRYFGRAIGLVADYLGAGVLAAYGLFLIARVLRTEAPEEVDDRWALFGIPLSLSVDNLVAGTSLGLLGFSPVFSAAVFGAITAVMSFIGLRLGRVAGRFVPIRMDLLSGITLIVMAIVLALGY